MGDHPVQHTPLVRGEVTPPLAPQGGGPQRKRLSEGVFEDSLGSVRVGVLRGASPGEEATRAHLPAGWAEPADHGFEPGVDCGVQAGPLQGAGPGDGGAQRAGAAPTAAGGGGTAGAGLRPGVRPQQPRGPRCRPEADVCLDGQAWMLSPHECLLSASGGSASLC